MNRANGPLMFIYEREWPFFVTKTNHITYTSKREGVVPFPAMAPTTRRRRFKTGVFTGGRFIRRSTKYPLNHRTHGLFM